MTVRGYSQGQAHARQCSHGMALRWDCVLRLEECVTLRGTPRHSPGRAESFWVNRVLAPWMAGVTVVPRLEGGPEGKGAWLEREPVPSLAEGGSSPLWDRVWRQRHRVTRVGQVLQEPGLIPAGRPRAGSTIVRRPPATEQPEGGAACSTANEKQGLCGENERHSSEAGNR